LAWINELAEFAYSHKGIESGQKSRWVSEETGYKYRIVAIILISFIK